MRAATVWKQCLRPLYKRNLHEYHHPQAHQLLNMATQSALEIKSHALSSNPDECFAAETKNGRYEKLEKLDPSTLSDNPKKSGSIRFVCISDTHSKTNDYHDRIPEGDVLIHAGDFTATSAHDEIVHFNDFLRRISHKFSHMVVIAGNHEISFDPKTWNKRGLKVALFKAHMGRNPLAGRPMPEQSKQLLTNCTYVENETVEVFGVKIYGSPVTPTFHDFAFNKQRGNNILEQWNKIPFDTDILVTHGPPLGIGDLCSSGCRVGCAELLSTVFDRVRPKFHVFGHIHEDVGVWMDGYGGTVFVNAASCDEKYRCVQPPVVFDYQVGGES